MFYSSKLEEVIFNFDDSLAIEPDELLIISGYLGPNPVQRLVELPYKTTVVGGMYNYGINSKLLSALNHAKSNNPNMELKFSDIEIHSKLYIWRKDKKIISALVGSANFSSNGLHSDLRETLALANRGSFPQMANYINTIEPHLVDEPPLLAKNEIIDFSTHRKVDIDDLEISNSIELPLYTKRKNGHNIVFPKSGINWGRSDGHVAIGDAYIAITKDLIEENKSLFKPYDPNFKNKITRKHRQAEPIELIWDDGFLMEASLEGSQTGADGKIYPKQLTSYSVKRRHLKDGTRISAKSILGRYLRNRMNIEDLEYQITYEDFIEYGRTSITFSIIEEGLYFCDFSVND